MRCFGWTLLTCALPPLLAATIADAQERGAIEIGAQARFTRLDSDIGLDPAIGAGARVAFLLGHDLSVELSAAYSESDLDRAPGNLRASYLPIALHLVRRDSLSPRTQFLYGGGIVRNDYGQDLDTYEYGGSALVGARWLLTQWLALRPEAVIDIMLSPSSGSTADFNIALQLGATVQLNRVAPSDRDFDGVPDLTDRCPLTTHGLVVDATGCPLEADDDVDGVPNVRDQCPRTPVTAVVDARGCPRFPDTTRVAPPPAPPPPTAQPSAPAQRREPAWLSPAAARPSAGAAHTALFARPPGQSYIRATRYPTVRVELAWCRPPSGALSAPPPSP